MGFILQKAREDFFWESSKVSLLDLVFFFLFWLVFFDALMACWEKEDNKREATLWFSYIAYQENRKNQFKLALYSIWLSNLTLYFPGIK